MRKQERTGPPVRNPRHSYLEALPGPSLGYAPKMLSMIE